VAGLTPTAKDMGLALHVEVTGPDGKIVDFYTENVLLRDGAVNHPLPIALNAASGRYRIKVVEAASGLTREAIFEVAPVK